MRFLDTNVLIYASGLNDEAEKTEIARRIVLDQDLVISVQILHEFFDRATRGLNRLSDAEAYAFMAAWRGFEVQPLSIEVSNRALSIRARYGFRIYDCAVVAAALEFGCDTLITEDLQHDQIIDRLRIDNPFRDV